VWFGESGEYAGASSTSMARALRAGLTNRPIQQTVNDTLAWHLRRPEAEKAKLSAGLSAEREQKVLSAWHAASAEGKS
jgi:2'-hydroxyisoflavone reductase